MNYPLLKASMTTYYNTVLKSISELKTQQGDITRIN